MLEAAHGAAAALRLVHGTPAKVRFIGTILHSRRNAQVYFFLLD